MSAQPHSLEGLWIKPAPRRKIRNRQLESNRAARNAGYRLGRANRHSHGADYATSEEWAAWLAGWREGWAEFNRTWERKVVKPRVGVSGRRELYLIETGRAL